MINLMNGQVLIKLQPVDITTASGFQVTERKNDGGLVETGVLHAIDLHNSDTICDKDIGSKVVFRKEEGIAWDNEGDSYIILNEKSILMLIDANEKQM